MRVVLVGRGRVGRGLRTALARASVDVTLTAGGNPQRRALAGADVVVLCTPDPAIASTAAKVSPMIGDAALLHCSGSLDEEVLAPHSPRGVMHPLVSFADPSRPPLVVDASFVIAGQPAARRAASRIARALRARPVVAELHGPAYHAAAALAANGAAALATVAVRVLTARGLDRRQAERAIGALLRTVGENVERIGVPAALSGPVIRGDVDAVSRHREALEALDPQARRAYDAVAPAILDCARRAGLDGGRAEAIEALLDGSADQPPSKT